MEKLELLARESMQEVDGTEPLPITSAAPLDLSQWTLERFRGDPPERKFLVDQFVPQGIAGTLYSAGGTGKSTLALDLSIRIAVADVIPTKWLNKFDVLAGGKVLYFSAEEPEDELHNRIKSIIAAIATETETPFDVLWPLCLKNLFVVNLWGTAKQLFDVKATSLEPSRDYWQIYNTLSNDFKLCVFDTRSRLSGAEGSGNALVSREVSFYEKFAADFGCTVLILHHTNKTSYSGDGNAAAAQRGESAFLDCLRLGIHLQTISEDVASANGIPSEDRFKYLAVTQAKTNYTAKADSIIVEREGWHYSLTDMKAKTTTGERKAKEEAADIEKIVVVVKENPGINQRGVIAKRPPGMSLHGAREALMNAVDLERIVETTGARAAKCYNVSTETN